MKPRPTSIIIIVLVAALALAACGGPSTRSVPASSSDTASGEGVTITNVGVTRTFDAPPERVVALHDHTVENLLRLGLEDRIVGIGFAERRDNIAPELREAFDRLNRLGDQLPSLEVVLDTDPDLVYGRESAFHEDELATTDRLDELGIGWFMDTDSAAPGAELDAIIGDLGQLGVLFGVEDAASDVIAELEGRVGAVRAAVADAEVVDVFVFDSGQDDAFTAGANLQTHLVELAGGRNVFDDLDTTWASVSWEEVVDRGADVIVVNDYGDTSADDKIALLRSRPELGDLAAIREDRFVVLDLASVFAGVRNAEAVEVLAAGFHPGVTEDPS